MIKRVASGHNVLSIKLYSVDVKAAISWNNYKYDQISLPPLTLPHPVRPRKKYYLASQQLIFNLSKWNCGGVFFLSQVEFAQRAHRWLILLECKNEEPRLDAKLEKCLVGPSTEKILCSFGKGLWAQAGSVGQQIRWARVQILLRVWLSSSYSLQSFYKLHHPFFTSRS